MSRWNEHDIERKREQLREDIERAEFDYDYPLDASGNQMNLHPKTDLHKFIVKEVIDRRATPSFALAKDAHADWRKIDYNLTAFVPASQAEELEKQRDSRIPVTPVVPMLYASREMYLTYTHALFCQDVIHRYRGRGGRMAKIRAAMLERIVHKQSQWFSEALKLQTMWSDAYAYGIGGVSPVWSKHKARRPMDTEVTAELFDMLDPDIRRRVDIGDIVRYLEEHVLYEGSELRNLDPYRLFLDPATKINEFQKSEYWGYLRRTNVMSILRDEADPEQRRFNGRYVRMLAEGEVSRSKFWVDESGRNRVWETEQDPVYGNKHAQNNTVDEIHMFIDLIPEEWGIGEQDYPVKWMFTVAGDLVVTQAEPLDLDHGRWPAVFCAPNTTGHDTFPISNLQVAMPAQETADWFIRTMVANQRKLQNDMLVVNPQFVEMKDVLRPGPGKVIRLKRSAYGDQDIRRYIQQLNVQDTTSHHMQHSEQFFDFINRLLGTDDIMRGDMSRMPERPTATGLSMAETGATSRQRRLSAVIAEQAMMDLGLQMAYNTIQYMSQDVEVSVLGRYEEWLKRELGLADADQDITISPMDLEASFEVEPLNKAVASPHDMNAITEVLKTVMGNEDALAQAIGQINVSGLFLAWARKAGFEDIHEFVLDQEQQPGQPGMNAQVMPDADVQQQTAAGNLVPIDDIGQRAFG